MASKNKKIKIRAGQKKTFRIPDRKGNVLICRHFGTISISLSLKLKTEKTARQLGTIHKKDKIFDTYRSRIHHYFRESKSYGFMYKLIKETTRFNAVRLRDEFGTYLIPINVIMDSGHVLQFQDAKDGESYELQYFLPVAIIEEYKVEAPF
jgi:hypothetical protein